MRKLKLMHRHYDAYLLLLRETPQQIEKLKLVPYIQIRSRLIQNHYLRLLAYRSCKQYSLPLSVTYLIVAALSQLCHMHQFHGIPDDFFFIFRKNAKSPRVRISS